MNLMVAICRYTWFLGITIWFCMVRRTHVNKNKDKTLYRISNFYICFYDMYKYSLDFSYCNFMF